MHFVLTFHHRLKPQNADPNFGTSSGAENEVGLFIQSVFDPYEYCTMMFVFILLSPD